MKYRLIIIMLAAASAGILICSTSNFGAGLTHDSVKYISAARNLSGGEGFTVYNGEPFVRWAPLYPALLALTDIVLRSDPLAAANILNGVILGLIILLSGTLALRVFRSEPGIGTLATFAVASSAVLASVAGMAWSEPAFILFTVAGFLLACRYIERKDAGSLILLAAAAGLSFLTRYIGYISIIWGVALISIHIREPKKKVRHAAIFTAVAATPAAIWLIRNYTLSGTFTGPRASSSFSLFENISLLFRYILRFYFPAAISRHPVFVILLVIISILSAYYIISSPTLRRGERASPVGPLMLFAALYLIMLTVTSSIIAYDRISLRLLSPVYIPLTLSLIFLLKMMIDRYNSRSAQIIPYYFLAAVIVLLCIMNSFRTGLRYVSFHNAGAGYSGSSWTMSDTVQYLTRNRSEISGLPLYTNDPDAAYILAGIIAERIPRERRYNSEEVVNTIDGLRGRWPPEERAHLVWFDKSQNRFLFNLDEIERIADLRLISRFKDGAVYSVRKRDTDG